MEFIIGALFIAGYAAIVFEQRLGIDKAAAALLTSVACWTAYILPATDVHLISDELMGHLAEISGILFFLMGAMTIVELIDTHEGFSFISERIIFKDKRKLLWAISLFTFFLSAVIDNLTAAIVMVSILRKLVHKQDERLLFCGMVIIAANAGGAWTPLGDITTTMLWIGGHITPVNIMLRLILPSLACVIIPLVYYSFVIKGQIDAPLTRERAQSSGSPLTPFQKKLVFFTGIGALLFVPVFKSLTHLPPFMGMLLGLGILWVITESMHRSKSGEDRRTYSISGALQKIDVPSILFFLGILVAVASLQSTGILKDLSLALDRHIGNLNITVLLIGLLSAIVDNVPLVAACMGMYDPAVFPTDHVLWEFLAYCAGTGGSVLVIGSAAGVVVMGLEKMSFLWYLRKVSLPALAGYLGGALIYIGLEHWF